MTNYFVYTLYFTSQTVVNKGTNLSDLRINFTQQIENSHTSYSITCMEFQTHQLL